jgi:hypothetical protein
MKEVKNIMYILIYIIVIKKKKNYFKKKKEFQDPTMDQASFRTLLPSSFAPSTFFFITILW